jgi:hypothetical protein
MGDVEDPELYAAFPLCEWEKTDHGKWVKEHANKTPEFFIRMGDHYGFKVVVEAEFTSENLLWYNLKYT